MGMINEFYTKDIIGLKEYLIKLADIGVDAIIVADPVVIDIVKNNYNENFQISINDKKTKLIKKNAHKKVTGITINDQNIKASKKLKNKIRQEIYFIIKNKKDYDNKLIGQIGYVLSIEANEYAFKIRDYVNNISEKYNYKENNLLKTINKMTKKFFR